MRIRVFLFGLLFVLLLSGCNTTIDTTNPQAATISVSGAGNANAVPDIVDIQLGVETINTDPVESVSDNTTKMSAVMAVLDQLGVAKTDIQTVYYNMWVENITDQNGQPTGEIRYHVVNQVNVRLRDLNQVGTLIEKATSAGATTVAGITFGVADTTELEQTALDDAITNATEKADRIASDMGVSLGKIVSVNESGAYVPSMPYISEKSVGGGGAVPISQGQFSMTTQVQVVYELAP
jgi:uncharacterized protein YggE